MRRSCVWLAAIAGLLVAWQGRGATVPEALVLDGIPPLPEGIREDVSRYLEFRSAAFQDWHPSRRDVLIVTRFGNTPQLHLVQQPEGARRQLTFLPEPVQGGSFQPADPSRLLFVQDTGGAEFFQFHELDRENGRIRLLTDGRSRNTGPVWSGDGRRLAYASTLRNGRDTDLYVMEPGREGSGRRLKELEGGGWSVLDWSPDDRHLLVRSYVSINDAALHLMDVATGELRRLSPEGDGPEAWMDARFLEEGRSVLAMTDRGSEFRRLMRLELAGGAWSPFGPEIPWDVEAMDVTRDGRRVAVFTNEDGVSRLHVLDGRTGRERKGPDLPAGVASGLSWHRNGRELGFSLSSARSPSDVYSIDVRVNQVTRWTVSETGGLNAGRFVEPEIVRVEGHDGLALSGFLYRPDPRRFPGRRPILVSIHGGPESQARPVFQMRWNYLLEEMGVAILYPNVRGSAGYGKRFLTLDNGYQREDSVRDIGAFLDWIGRDERLAADRIGVYGGSYGGYMVLASLIHHGNRLRCGIDVVGISSFLTFLKNTQDYRRDLRRVEYGDERDPAMAEFLARISPLSRAGEIRKPLLVVQGLNDPRVPAGESEQVVRAIRGQGGTAWYLLAKDEGHGFAKKANSDFMFLTLVQFLQQHLL